MHALYSAAAPCGQALQREAAEKLKIRIGQYWGMSETTGAVTGSDVTRDTKAGSCGQVLAGMQMRIVGEDGQTLEHGKAGEVSRDERRGYASMLISLHAAQRSG